MNSYTKNCNILDTRVILAYLRNIVLLRQYFILLSLTWSVILCMKRVNVQKTIFTYTVVVKKLFN